MSKIKPIKKKKKVPVKPTWVACGFDISMSSISGAAILWDATREQLVGPATTSKRWQKDVHYFDRLDQAAHGQDFVLDLLAPLKLNVEHGDIYIAIEEPWPMGIFKMKNFQSAWAKQQAQIHGAFFGSLVRYGYRNVYEVNNTTWRAGVAEEMGITTHHSKWHKWVPKEWALEFFEGVPDLPDLINSTKHGLIPRPEDSVAKAVQPDDIYDALGIMAWMQNEVEVQIG